MEHDSPFHRLMAPRPISRPPVDSASRHAFGRPAGFEGSFLGSEEHRDQGELAPRNAAPDPVLREAFGRPVSATQSLQRHPADAGALDGERDDEADIAADPWRDPDAAASLRPCNDGHRGGWVVTDRGRRGWRHSVPDVGQGNIS